MSISVPECVFRVVIFVSPCSSTNAGRRASAKTRLSTVIIGDALRLPTRIAIIAGTFRNRGDIGTFDIAQVPENKAFSGTAHDMRCRRSGRAIGYHGKFSTAMN